MPAPRIIDSHPKREQIEFCLCNGMPFQQAEEYFGISERTLARHLRDLIKDKPEAFRRFRCPGIAPADILEASKQYAREHNRQVRLAAEAAFNAVSK